MAHGAHDWLAAAACAEGPRLEVTFADLPRQHRGELVRFVAVAAASVTYFVTLAMLGAPLPSRSLAAGAALPHAGPSRAPVLEARLAQAAVEPAPLRPRSSAARPAVRLAALREPVGGPPSLKSSPRRNPFSRFFRGVLRTVTPN